MTITSLSNYPNKETGKNKLSHLYLYFLRKGANFSIGAKGA